MIVLFILIATCAEITIVLLYFQLCAEDYHWWWRSFLTAGCSGLYLFIYSLVYMFTKMNMAMSIFYLAQKIVRCPWHGFFIGPSLDN
mgnify:CR=1 FL=1